MMFATFCPRHDARVLIWPSGIDAIVNHEQGIDVHFHCTCGYRGICRTGRTSTEQVGSEACHA